MFYNDNLEPPNIFDYLKLALIGALVIGSLWLILDNLNLGLPAVIN